MKLRDAEIIAGVRTRAARKEDSNIIDICTIDTSAESSSYDKKLAEQLREKIGSRSLFLDSSSRMTLVALNFDEAHLAKEVIEALRPYKPSYVAV
ncbi:hypothetical protein H9L39_16541 [Fusarium oxysporum f. sp. albedinis]|nr:hypothetical protein H9L39_16541 [Fusarium oxysporum f. sp. albedinis]